MALSNQRQDSEREYPTATPRESAVLSTALLTVPTPDSELQVESDSEVTVRENSRRASTLTSGTVPRPLPAAPAPGPWQWRAGPSSWHRDRGSYRRHTLPVTATVTINAPAHRRARCTGRCERARAPVAPGPLSVRTGVIPAGRPGRMARGCTEAGPSSSGREPQ
jgi:hypothetical protein